MAGDQKSNCERAVLRWGVAEVFWCTQVPQVLSKLLKLLNNPFAPLITLSNAHTALHFCIKKKVSQKLQGLIPSQR